MTGTAMKPCPCLSGNMLPIKKHVTKEEQHHTELEVKEYQECQLVMGAEIVRACDRHSNETVTLRKHVTN